AVLKAIKDASFDFGKYRFVYQQLIVTSDDHKDATTAAVGIYLLANGEKIGMEYPAKWDFHRGEQMTTEVAIKVRFEEDVYVVMNGYNDPSPGAANFRVFLNPLILWVWLGFLCLAFGVFICLIPQRLVDYVSNRPIKTRLGRAADAGLFVAVLVG